MTEIGYSILSILLLAFVILGSFRLQDFIDHQTDSKKMIIISLVLCIISAFSLLGYMNMDKIKANVDFDNITSFFQFYNTKLDNIAKDIQSNIDQFEKGDLNSAKQSLVKVGTDCAILHSLAKMYCDEIYSSESALLNMNYSLKPDDLVKYGGKDDFMPVLKEQYTASVVKSKQADELVEQAKTFEKELKECSGNNSTECKEIINEANEFFNNINKDLEKQNEPGDGDIHTLINQYGMSKTAFLNGYKSRRFYEYPHGRFRTRR